MDYFALGQNMRRVRLQQKMTQQNVAERMNVSTSFVGHLERGTRIPSLETFVSMCKALEIDPNSLLMAEISPPAMPAITQETQTKACALLEYACHLAGSLPQTVQSRD